MAVQAQRSRLLCCTQALGMQLPWIQLQAVLARMYQTPLKVDLHLG